MFGRIQTIQRRDILPVIGKIKVGVKSDKGYPQSVDYFVPGGKYSEFFRRAYGDKPQRIQIVFLSDNAEDVCCEEYVYRDKGGGLVAKGDGVLFDVWSAKAQKYVKITTRQATIQEPTTDAIFDANLFDDLAKHYEGGVWKMRLTLRFALPMVRGIAGLWQFESSGAMSTIPNITAMFDRMKEERGQVRGVIFDLCVKFAQSQKPNVKSRYPVVTLVPNCSEENMRMVKQAQEPIAIENIKV